MNRRESLMTLAVLGGGGMTGCAVSQSTDPRMAIDDGMAEITPVYIVTYTEGQPTAFVRADFLLFDANKEVQLRADGVIKVNGIQLGRDPKELVSYIGNIRVSETFTFELTRQTGRVTQHSFSLPQLEIVNLPRQYLGREPIRAVVRSAPIPKGVMEDKYRMTVFGRFGESRLLGKLTGGSELIFEAGQHSASPPGRYRADIYRQQRTALKDISNSKTGWAVLSHIQEFLIDVPEQ